MFVFVFVFVFILWTKGKPPRFKVKVQGPTFKVQCSRGL